MALRDDLKNFIPMYLWETMNHPEGYIITAEEFNSIWNRIQTQGDANTNWIRDILLMLYETVLSDTDGVSHINVNMPAYQDFLTLAAVLQAINNRQVADAVALSDHKVSANHDSRYYTKALLDGGQLDIRYTTTAALLNNALGSLYYTKAELLPFLRGGDTLIREDTFTILTADNGNGTFTYSYGGEEIIGSLGMSGEQIFTMQSGTYNLKSNAIEAIINDTLRRSVASGGLEEIDGSQIALTSPEGAGAEVTFKYYERLGMAAEYNIKVSATQPPLNNGKTMWFQEL